MSEEKYSPGLEGVIVGETAISSILDGLRYRGYAIEDLAEHGTYEEVAHLLLHGELPTATELSEFRQRLVVARTVPPAMLDALGLIPDSVSAMDALRSGVSLLGHFDPETGDNSPEATLRKAERLLARIPTIIAARHRLKHGLTPIPPRPDLNHATCLLAMVTGRDPSEAHARAFDVSLILYAEHEFNASTFACRVTASTLSDLYSAATSGVGTLKGPLHGGANEEVIKMLLEIGSPERAEPWVRQALSEKRLVMGFGHRVYKKEDPRAEISKGFCRSLAEACGNKKLEEIAKIVERIVQKEKGLPANLDWPIARMYHYLGLEVELYTPMFVAARVAGWAAHVIEQLGHNRLYRPLGRYSGPANRKVVPLAQRI